MDGAMCRWQDHLSWRKATIEEGGRERRAVEGGKGMDISTEPTRELPSVLTRTAGIDLDQFMDKDRRRILIVDDEPETITLIKHLFIKRGFDVAGAMSGKEALSRLTDINPSLVLLDIMMPEMDGWQAYENLRAVSTVPVIAISAVDQTESIVHALQIGFDDYITKPFNAEEVAARANNVLRRATQKNTVNRIGFTEIQLILDLETQEIFYRGKRIQLTGKMFEVLALLARNAPHLVSYDEMTKNIWNETSAPARNRLKYLVYLLRQEMNEVDDTCEIIKNIDRLGYKLITTNE